MTTSLRDALRRHRHTLALVAVLAMPASALAQDLTLEHDPVVPGTSVTITISGLFSGETVYLARNTAGIGSGPCPGAAGGLCLDLVAPRRASTGSADAAGVASISLSIPGTVPLGAEMGLQAVALRGAGGVDSVKSTAVLAPIVSGTDTGVTEPTGPFGIEVRPSNPTCLAPPRPATEVSVRLQDPFPMMDYALWGMMLGMEQPPGDPSRWYAINQYGLLFTWPNSPTVTGDQVDIALDLSGLVSTEGEEGLLGMAFHPDYDVNGELFLHYVWTGGGGTSRVERVVTYDGGATFERLPAGSGILLEMAQPLPWHNGGDLAFGPDGYLYISFGETEMYADRAQDPYNWWGTVLRIDVDGGSPYAIPADNPFAAAGGAPEVYAYGFRNPWRMSFDQATGDLWVADVGDATREEINQVELGGNYGWNHREGLICFADGPSCSSVGMTDPVLDYTHAEGQAVIGGYVYRGPTLPELQGTYLFTDYPTGTLWGLFYDEVTGAPGMQVLANAGSAPGSMAQSLDGEVFVLLDGGGIRQVVPDAGMSSGTFPTLFSETGCGDPVDPQMPAEGLIPYDVQAPLWSDGATKERWLAMPDGTQIAVAPDGQLTYPIGTVLRKDFHVDGILAETRLLVRHDDGNWAGYTYAWREDGTDADWISGGQTEVVGTVEWTWPSSSQCLSCHTEVAGRVLGPHLGQLNGDFLYPSGTTANQVATWDHIGLFWSTVPSGVAVLPRYDDLTASAEAIAKAYLHSNCAHCHQPGGPGRGPADFRFTTTLADMGVCDVAPTLGDMGISGAMLVAPGAPESSIVPARMSSLDAYRMPPLGTNLVDAEGLVLVEDWIAGIASCPP